MVTSIMRRAMLYLGLAPEEDYDELGAPQIGEFEDAGAATVTRIAEPEPQRPMAALPHRGHEPSSMGEPSTGREHSAGRDYSAGAGQSPGAVRTISREAAQASGVRVPGQAGGAGGASVRTIPVTHAKPHVVAPQSFNEAQTVADRFRGDQPVIMNLQEVDRELRRRLIDFASGLTYGLSGRMDRIADGVYLLSPVNVEVSDDERRRLQERGLHT